MLALRSILVIDALDEGALRTAARSAADAIVIDLAHASVHGQRAEARSLAAKHAKAIAKTWRPVLVRVNDPRSEEMTADLDAVVSDAVSGVWLAGAEEPQNVRDADVQIRKFEMRRKLTPGATMLVPEIDSAEALMALPRTLLAVNRFGAVALSVDGLRADLRLGASAGASSTMGAGAMALYAHAMAEVAIQSDAARLPWLLHVSHHRPGTESLSTMAHDCGAAGVTVHNEGEARGVNSLFAPGEQELAIARAMVAEWARVRKRGGRLGVVAGEVIEAPGYDRLVDRRTVRRAEALVELAAAIERRERVG